MDQVLAWVAIVGVVTGVGTLWLAYREARKAVYIRLAERAESLMGRMIDIEQIAVDHPELVPYLFEGQPVAAADPNRNAVLAYALLFVDFAEMVGWQIRTGELSRDGGEAWKTYFLAMYEGTPAIQEVFTRDQDYYCDETKWLFGRVEVTDITRHWGQKSISPPGRMRLQTPR